MKTKAFQDVTASEFVSKTFAQKKYLGWKDVDILANREFLRKDAELVWELEQIKANGPGWKEAVLAQDLAPEGGAGGMGPDMGGGPPPGGGAGPGGTPPPFTGGPPDIGGEAPEAGAPPETPPPG
jgi:hypothetical protein